MIKFSDNQNTRKISEAEYEYDAFGATVSQSGALSDSFRHRFSTKPWIAALGAYDYGERLYSPELRRWLSRDPIEEEGGVNLYAMCGNDAVNGIDYLGLKRWYMFYYSNNDQPAFKLAAETAKREIERSLSFRKNCDIVVLHGVLTDMDFVSRWNSMLKDGLKEKFGKVQEVRIFTHSGIGRIFMYETAVTEKRVLSLDVAEWETDGRVVLHGCFSGVGGIYSLASIFAERQGVIAEGQAGASSFSTSRDFRAWYTRVGSFSQSAYLWSYGDGSRTNTFGHAMDSIIVHPKKARHK